MKPSDDTARIAAAVKEANDAFWSVIVKHFPEATTGDLDDYPQDTMTAWVARWVELNADPCEDRT